MSRETTQAKVFWTGRSQAVRLPKGFRLDSEMVTIRRKGRALVLEPVAGWPDGWVESFADATSDLTRPPQGVAPKTRLW